MSKALVPNLENVIIFGASSFLGRSLRKIFLNTDTNVYAVFRKSSQNDEVKSFDGENHIFFDEDIESLRVLKHLPKDRTVVINCCGVTGLPNEIENLSSILDANMVMTSKILKFMCISDFKKLIITESYWQFDESGSEMGNTLYAEAKNMQSSLARYFSRKYNMNVVGLVLYDVYGERDDRPKILNKMAQSIALNHKLDLTDGNQFVDFVHISDVVNAYLLTSKLLIDLHEDISPCFTRFFVKTNEPLTILKSKVSETLSILGYKAKLNWAARPSPDYQIYKPFWPNEANLLVPNWKCKVSFKQGLERLISEHEK